MSSNSEMKKALTMENLNPRVIDVEYAVRGPIVIRAAEIEKELKTVIFIYLNFIYLFIYSSRVIISINSIELFERILVIVMQAVIKYL
jgi:hypothetical protein